MKQGITTRCWRLKDYLEAHRGEGYLTIEKICSEVTQLMEFLITN